MTDQRDRHPDDRYYKAVGVHTPVGVRLVVRVDKSNVLTIEQSNQSPRDTRKVMHLLASDATELAVALSSAASTHKVQAEHMRQVRARLRRYEAALVVFVNTSDRVGGGIRHERGVIAHITGLAGGLIGIKVDRQSGDERLHSYMLVTESEAGNEDGWTVGFYKADNPERSEGTFIEVARIEDAARVVDLQVRVGNI